jgi:hypothetical protein
VTQECSPYLKQHFGSHAKETVDYAKRKYHRHTVNVSANTGTGQQTIKMERIRHASSKTTVMMRQKAEHQQFRNGRESWVSNVVLVTRRRAGPARSRALLDYKLVSKMPTLVKEVFTCNIRVATDRRALPKAKTFALQTYN